jgi:hypothetical protein
MPLTLPELDDRRYADLVEEARGLLVGLAPSLTNHNPSDPIVTIAELFAYFTDALLFRLNYVTDDNRRAFLRLLNGPEWQAPAHRDGLDAEVRRTVLQLRSVQRAVTAADYELLAREADAAGHIARVRCVPGFDLSPRPAMRSTRCSNPSRRISNRDGCSPRVCVSSARASCRSKLTSRCACCLMRSNPRRVRSSSTHSRAISIRWSAAMAMAGLSGAA